MLTLQYILCKYLKAYYIQAFDKACGHTFDQSESINGVANTIAATHYANTLHRSPILICIQFKLSGKSLDIKEEEETTKLMRYENLGLLVSKVFTTFPVD